MARSVALLAEGVDRNWSGGGMVLVLLSSPSSRRAWIEMHITRLAEMFKEVALLAEGVDRNWTASPQIFWNSVALLAEGVDRNFPPTLFLQRLVRRPPRGGRG